MLFPLGLMFSLTWLGLYGFFRGMDIDALAVEVVERPKAGIASSLAWGLNVVNHSHSPSVWSPCYLSEAWTNPPSVYLCSPASSHQVPVCVELSQILWIPKGASLGGMVRQALLEVQAWPFAPPPRLCSELTPPHTAILRQSMEKPCPHCP